MAIVFCLVLIVYSGIAVFTASGRDAVLSQTLWVTYFLLGISGSAILLTELIPTVYPPEYLSTLFLSACILICVWAFRNVRSEDVLLLAPSRFVVRSAENILIVIQGCSIFFFLPFAVSAVSGDPSAYRLSLADTQDVLASYGVVNTIAGHASHLFTASLLLAFLRLSPANPADRSVARATALALCSLSWVVYVLAYAGRDGVVYWGMTAVVLYLLFRRRLSARDRTRIVRIAPVIGVILLFPLLTITASRFFGYDGGGFAALFEYFGAQIQNFSDYSALDRPRTNGLRTLPMFYGPVCEAVHETCATWPEVQDDVFQDYLIQEKQPWLFGTFVSDFVGDFGYLGTFLIVCAFAAIVDLACGYRQRGRNLSLPRLLLILLLFQVPYWGVFYFRFSIANGFLVVNVAFCVGLLFLEKILHGSVGASAPEPDDQAARVRSLFASTLDGRRETLRAGANFGDRNRPAS